MSTKVDLIIDIDFDLNSPTKSVIFTNVKHEQLKEIIFHWLRTQIGKGADLTPPREKDRYQVKIGLDLNEDTFATESDCGNESLKCGIVQTVLSLLPNLTVYGLRESSQLT